MNKKLYLPILIAIITAFIVFTPHYNYDFPLHIDEWHHIAEAQRLDSGEYSGGQIGFRLGFHVFLLSLSKIIPLLESYQFLPAIWAAITSLVLFYVVSKKFNYATAIFAMIFFASLKSNVNLLGLWFFVPLTFSLPFILLFMHFFDQGLQKHSKKHIIISLIIMLFLIPVHSISVLFALPILFIYSLFNLQFIKNNKKFFLSFLLIPILGVIFFSQLTNLPILESISSIIQQLQFQKGWGVLEINNSPLEIYSLIGYLFAGLGFFSLYKSNKRKYSLYLIWPALLVLSIIFFRLLEVSYLSPYQRNVYYLALVLPILSAAGLNYLITNLSKFNFQKTGKTFLIGIVILLTIILSFYSYSAIPEQIGIYHVIENQDYQVLLELQDLPRSTIMAPPFFSTAIYPITNHLPVGTVSFYGNRQDIEAFFKADCQSQSEILDKHKAEIIVSNSKINCNYNLISSKNNKFIYKR